MKFVLSNIFLINFCRRNSTQKTSNSISFFNVLNNRTIILFDDVIYVFEFTKCLFFKKLPLITENGGVFSYQER